MIFKPFLNNTDTNIGIGLSVSRKLLKILGGRVEINSFPGSGTCVKTILPLTGSCSSKKEQAVGEVK